MGDVYCAKCGEPWDAYGVLHGDMTKEEAKRFLNGEGCPCCDFGREVPEGQTHEEDFWESMDEIMSVILG